MSTFLRLTLFIFLLLLALLTEAKAQTRSATISILNESAPPVEVELSIEVFGAPPQLFDKVSSNNFQYKFAISEDKWFNPVDIKILWKNAYLRTNGSKSDFEQRISLRIRRDFPSQFTFPIFFSNDRTQSEMLRLERLTDISDQFEAFFRSWQITDYYRDSLGAQSPITKRMAKCFFWAAVKLAEQPSYFVIMSDDAQDFVIQAFGSSTEYKARSEQAKSVYWFDLSQIDTHVKKGDCVGAQLLLKDFQDLYQQQPEMFELRFKAQGTGESSSVLKDKAKIVETCSEKRVQ